MININLQDLRQESNTALTQLRIIIAPQRDRANTKVEAGNLNSNSNSNNND